MYETVAKHKLQIRQCHRQTNAKTLKTTGIYCQALLQTGVIFITVLCSPISTFFQCCSQKQKGKSELDL